jgi:2-dehydro-3-deoxyphosphogluconate aldolase/(4S)-4-hydroxy-2-oxoglutarate aldolase
MDVGEWQGQLQLSPAIAVIRAPTVSLGLSMAAATAAAGMRLIEITWTSDRPATLIQQLQASCPIVGLGQGRCSPATMLRRRSLQGHSFALCPTPIPA